MQSIEDIISYCLTKYDNNIVENIFKNIEDYSPKDLNDIKKLKQLKGSLFESWCLLYLKHIKKYNNVWLLKDIPDDVLSKLSLKRNDQGIDLVCEHNGKFICVQSKFRESKNKSVNWKQLSTFYALCMKTKMDAMLIMTNCSYIKRVGVKYDNETSICLKSFLSLTRKELEEMIGIKPHKLSDEVKPKIEDIRELRLKYFQNDNKDDGI